MHYRRISNLQHRDMGTPGSSKISITITDNHVEGLHSRHPDKNQAAEDTSMASRIVRQQIMDFQRK